MSSDQSNQNTYILDTSSGAEMARLIEQDLMITNVTGLFPDELDLTDVRRVLDVACGPGGWALKVARYLPDVEVVGADISVSMIDYANALAQVELLENASFRVMDATRRLDFLDASFDVVNARLMVAFVYKRVWPEVVQEFSRLVRPGGWIILSEPDKLYTTNSEAEERLFAMGVQAMLQAGFYAGTSDGVTPHLASLLQTAGCSEIHTKQHRLDFSSGTPAYKAIMSNLRIALYIMQPFLLKMGYSSQEELNALYEQSMKDIASASFRGHMDLTTVWGSKELKSYKVKV